MKPLIFMTVLAGTAMASEAARTTVLAELFTSEGCSSCPPADALLIKLDKLQPVEGVQIIVLSEHVDYWNSLGWADPFSSAQFTQRQAAYARTLTDESYTPQLVIDGRSAFVGSNEREIVPAIAKAAARAKTQVKIASAKREGEDALVTIAVGAPSAKADVWLALADERDQSNVRRGENSGRALTHVAVVRSLVKVGSVSKSAGFEKEIRVPAGTGPMRVVVFVASSGGPVLGSAMQELP